MQGQNPVREDINKLKEEIGTLKQEMMVHNTSLTTHSSMQVCKYARELYTIVCLALRLLPGKTGRAWVQGSQSGRSLGTRLSIGEEPGDEAIDWGGAWVRG